MDQSGFVSVGANSCVFGCTDSTAMNYDSTANVNEGCIYPILGCTDVTALNYDPSATVDDSSCVACPDNSLALSMFDAYSDGWNGATFSMTYGSESYSTTLSSGGSAVEYLCMPTGCYDIVVGGGNYDEEMPSNLMVSSNQPYYKTLQNTTLH